MKLTLVRGRGVAYAENYSPSATKSGNEKEEESTLRPDHAACEVRSPAKLARLFRRDKTMSCQPAKFGAPLPRNGTVAEAVFASPLKGCDPLNVTANYSGKIVIVERGTCTFNVKAIHAQRAGAKALVVINYPNTELFDMDLPNARQNSYRSEPVTIPAVLISARNATILRNSSSASIVLGLYGIFESARRSAEFARPERGAFRRKFGSAREHFR